MRVYRILHVALILLLVSGYSLTAQDFGDGSLSIEKVVFRPAKWEQEQVREERNERPNKGGLIFVYYKNNSDETIQIARFIINRQDEGYFTQSGDVAWTRHFGDRILPGETKVYEINAVSELFSEGKPFSFGMIGRKTWSVIAGKEMTLAEEPMHITSMIWQEDLKHFTFHLESRSDRAWEFKNLSISGKKLVNLETTATTIEAGGHMILTGEVEEAFSPGTVCLASVELENGGESIRVLGHRTCYASYFAIGTWGIDEHRYDEAKNKLHLNTFIKGGKSKDEFYTKTNRDYGFKVLTHTGMYPDVEKIQDLKGTEDIAFWYLQDEPDANRTAEAVLFSNEMVKELDVQKPTITTLCRNVRFFEFAFIPDVACMDHYSVGAPTSSVWPHRYGTRLEETGYYTRDLRLAAYPKPIWIWSQGLFNWSQRPRQQVPTPKELTYQLLSNLGNGAKGILWFTIKESKGEQYPETYLAMQQGGRIMEMLKDDLLQSEPLQCEVEADSKLLVHPLISKDKLILIVLNTDYSIDPVAYQWNARKDVDVQLEIPAWLKLESGFELLPDKGVKKAGFQQEGRSLQVRMKDLDAYKVYVFDADKAELEALQAEYKRLKELER